MENKKLYTEQDLRNAFNGGVNYGGEVERNPYRGITENLNEDEFIADYIKPKESEEETIPITIGLIKNTCGWSEYCDVTNGNHYAFNEGWEPRDSEIEYVKKSHAIKLGFIK